MYFEGSRDEPVAQLDIIPGAPYYPEEPTYTYEEPTYYNEEPTYSSEEPTYTYEPSYTPEEPIMHFEEPIMHFEEPPMTFDAPLPIDEPIIDGAPNPYVFFDEPSANVDADFDFGFTFDDAPLLEGGRPERLEAFESQSIEEEVEESPAAATCISEGTVASIQENFVEVLESHQEEVAQQEQEYYTELIEEHEAQQEET